MDSCQSNSPWASSDDCKCALTDVAGSMSYESYKTSPRNYGLSDVLHCHDLRTR
jgi:hypothetical protein